MANAFSPDIGMDIGASNVRPYQPDAIDYSTLGRAFSGLFPEASAPTEGQRDDTMIAPFAADLYRIDQIEDPSKKEIYFRQAYKNALATMPGQTAKVKSLYDEMRGISLPTGSPISQGEAVLADFMKTPEGQTAVLVAQSKAVRPDGTMDSTLYSAALSESAFRYNQELAVNSRLEREVQIGDRSAEVVFENDMLPAMITKANQTFSEITSTPVLSQILKGQGDAVQVQTMIDGLKGEMSRLEASFMQTKARAGITSGDEKYSLKPAMAQFVSLITVLETNQTTLQNAASNLTKDDAARYIINAKDPLTRMALSDQNAKSQLLIGTLSRDSKRLSEVQDFLLAPSTLQNSYSAPEADQGMSDSRPIENLGLEDRFTILPEFSKEAITVVSQKPVSWKQEQIKSGLFMLNAFTPETIKTSDQAIHVADTLGYTYLSLIDRPQSSPSTSKQVQDVFGTKAFANMEAVAKASPSTGAALYKQAHKYAQDEINKQTDSLTANFATIASMEMNPFEVVLEKGQVVLKLNEEAVRSDPDLRKAMSTVRVTGRGPGQFSSTVTETDPYKVLENYMGLFNRTSGRYSDIVDNIKSLNVLYNQMGRLPEDIRNSEYSGQVYLADRISRLPGWRPTATPQAQPGNQ